MRYVKQYPSNLKTTDTDRPFYNWYVNSDMYLGSNWQSYFTGQQVKQFTSPLYLNNRGQIRQYVFALPNNVVNSGISIDIPLLYRNSVSLVRYTPDLPQGIYKFGSTYKTLDIDTATETWYKTTWKFVSYSDYLAYTRKDKPIAKNIGMYLVELSTDIIENLDNAKLDYLLNVFNNIGGGWIPVITEESKISLDKTELELPPKTTTPKISWWMVSIGLLLIKRIFK